jgi:hypothetical protein
MISKAMRMIVHSVVLHVFGQVHALKLEHLSDGTQQCSQYTSIMFHKTKIKELKCVMKMRD